MHTKENVPTAQMAPSDDATAAAIAVATAASNQTFFSSPTPLSATPPAAAPTTSMSVGTTPTATVADDGTSAPAVAAARVLLSQISVERVKQMGSALFSFASTSVRESSLATIDSRQTLVGRLRREMVLFLDFRAFSKPSDRIEWISRLRANTVHLPLCYASIYGIVMANVLLTSIALMLQIAMFAGLWAMFFVVRDADAPVRIGSFELGRAQKTMVLSAVGAVLFLFGGFLSSLIWVFLFGSFLVGLHASFRNKIELDPIQELELNEGESSAFVGDVQAAEEHAARLGVPPV